MITLNKATAQIGVGIADSDPVMVMSPALNAYNVVSDNTSRISGLRIFRRWVRPTTPDWQSTAYN